jgi:hypothetical protein
MASIKKVNRKFSIKIFIMHKQLIFHKKLYNYQLKIKCFPKKQHTYVLLMKSGMHNKVNYKIKEYNK